MHGFTEGLHADLAERAAALVGHQHHGNSLLVGDGAQDQVFAGEQAFQVAGQQGRVLGDVGGRQAQLCGFVEQAAQHLALARVQAQAAAGYANAEALLAEQAAVGAVTEQDQQTLHAAGLQGVAGAAGELQYVGKGAGFAQQFGAVLAPGIDLGFHRGGCGGRFFCLQMARIPWPQQGLGRVPEFGFMVAARALGGMLVHELLQIIEAELQVQGGELLPAPAGFAVPGLMGANRQAVGQQDAVGRQGQPAAQVAVVIQMLLLLGRLLAAAGNAQGFDQLAAVIQQQAVAMQNPFGQPPFLGQGQAQLQQRHAEQLLFDLAGRFAVDQHPLLPGRKQFRVAGNQWPEWREKQQAAALNVVP